ncbi:MFS transporter [Streptomyces sp. TS71-3]|nr:MFS transporter [Streptomyces sp. TS71-3]
MRPAATLAVTSAATAVALMSYTAPMVTLSDTAASLGSSVSVQAWLLNGAPLGLAALLLVAGSLADDYGRRKVFLSGTLALGITTALGALATDTWLFVLARLAQGAASAAVLASSLGLLVHAFPTAHGRVRATGVWGAFVSGGIALGPLLAGWLATFDWRWAYVVLGIAGLLIAALGGGALVESKAPRPGRPDLAGAAALSGALVALLAALTLGRDGWVRPSVGLLLLAFALLIWAFVAVERRTASPMIDLGLLRRPLFLAASSGGLFTGLAVIGLYSFLPTLVQGALGLSPLGTAWLYMAWSGTSFVVALQARRLVQSPRLAGRISARHQLALGFVLHAAGVLTMLGAMASGHWTRLLPGLFITGVGSGLLNAALPLLAVESVPRDRAAMGSGANNTARYIGSSAGVALTIAVATTAGGGGSRGGAAALAHGTDIAVLVSAGLAVVAAVAALVLRERR